ncbi:zinc finger CCCH-type with G patch domain-containing protein [Planococcus citri]|uniref:zinc finger CCCH-type with G patch domain-containing protein n=1 Tax=Planococcus citri TaxID=170843 RepID=UPI0031F79697
MESDDPASLKEALTQYESQLTHVTNLIQNSDQESLAGLNSLKSKLVELIELTKESLASQEPTETNTNSSNNIDDEYALFMSEVGDTDQSESVAETKVTPKKNTDTEGQKYDPEKLDISEDEDNIMNELNSLIGIKCQAPYSENWTGAAVTYHNALIMSIDSIEDSETLKIRVIFINPTSQKMIPCNYFLDGDCKFSDERCRFSHGYVVSFSDLKEYKEPDFSLIKENIQVLAKDTDNLWKRAIVKELISEENQCTVQFESGSKKIVVIDLHDTLPLLESEENDMESESCTHPNSGNAAPKQSISNEEHEAIVEKSLTQQPLAEKLGGWEQHTKSIGSRLMAKMGYVVGTGLGKRGEGRVEPVAAVVLPPGKSLDHCMKLREAAGGDPNLFKAEKYQQKLQNKIIARNARKQNLLKKPRNVFNFINDSLSSSSSKQSHSFHQDEPGLKTSSAQQLNVEELKVSERIDKKKYELYVLQDTLTRQKKNTVGFNSVAKKLKQAQMELDSLQNKLKDVNKEQSYRKTMKELTKF